ncbi:ABC transporter ATP-binding protein [Devosia sp.]|uniref:ABC transporter ATP-binding protein n=1 Tax=Devosia sp. TaxID=1871048 RepID=UPI003A94F1CE
MSAPATHPVTAPVLTVEGLEKRFAVRGTFGRNAKTVHALSEVSLSVRKGQTVGIVGESGCGKSTVARVIMGLIRQDDGIIRLHGQPSDHLPASLKKRRRIVQMVFQDSSASLNPRLNIEASIMFAPMVNGTSRDEARTHAHHLLERTGLDPAQFAGRYPHELSGGQRQRVNIARALALRPELIIFDEAVSALDKSVEAQVLNLLLDLKKEFDLSYLFISHDLNVVHYISDDLVVMYLGQIVERGPADLIYAHPGHPYTRALLAAMPNPDPETRTETAPVFGDPPSPIDPPSGCRFHTRCPFAEAVCEASQPDQQRIGADHDVACHMADGTSGHSRAGSIEQ